MATDPTLFTMFAELLGVPEAALRLLLSLLIGKIVKGFLKAVFELHSCFVELLSSLIYTVQFCQVFSRFSNSQQ